MDNHLRDCETRIILRRFIRSAHHFGLDDDAKDLLPTAGLCGNIAGTQLGGAQIRFGLVVDLCYCTAVPMVDTPQWLPDHYLHDLRLPAILHE
jgi:hypothetical protein